MDRLKVSIGNLREQIGGYLIPVVDKAAALFADYLLPAVSSFAGFVQQSVTPVFAALSGAAKQTFDILFRGDITVGPLAEDSKIVGVLLKLRDGFVVVGGVARQTFDILFRGDFKGGPLDEDSKVVGVLFRLRDGLAVVGGVARQAFDVLFRGDFTGGPLQEDSPLISVLLKIRDGFERLSVFVKANLVPILIGLGVAVAVLAGPAVIGAFVTILSTAVTIVGTVAAVIGGALVGALGALLSPAVLVAGAIGAVVAVFLIAYRESLPLRAAVAELGSTFSVFLAAFRNADTAGGIAGFFAGISAGIKAALPVVQSALLGIGQALVDWIAPRIVPLIVQIGGLFEAVGAWLINVGLPKLTGYLAFLGQALTTWVVPQIVPTVTALGQFIAALGGYITGVALPSLGTYLLRLGQALVDWIAPQIVPMIRAIGLAGGFVGNLIDWLLNVGLPTVITALRSFATAIWAWVGPAIPILLGELGHIVGSAIGYIIGTGLPLLIGALLVLSYELVKWVAPRVPGLLLELGKLQLSIITWIFTTGIPTLVKGMYEFGKSALGGFFQALADSPLVDKLGEFFGRAVDSARTKFLTGIALLKEGINRDLIRPLNDLLGHFGVPAIPSLNSVLPGFNPAGRGSRGGVQEFASGGLLHGPGTGTSDSILGVNDLGVPTAKVSNGEYVVKKRSVDKYGVGFMDRVNAGVLPGYFLGGLVGDAFGAIQSWLAKGARFASDKLFQGAESFLGAAVPAPPLAHDTATGIVRTLGRAVGDVLAKAEAREAAASAVSGSLGSGSATSRGWGPPGPPVPLTRINVPGVPLQVRSPVAGAFTQLVSWLTAARRQAGVPALSSSGGYNFRKIAGTDVWSNHAWGLAADFNAATNPYGVGAGSDMPPGTSAKAAQLGMRWGGDYRGKRDAMHFEFMGRSEKAGLTTMAKGGVIREPVHGLGLTSGRQYLLGENGPETVTPGVRGAGPQIHYHGNFYSYDPSDIAREQDRKMRDALAVYAL